ncbi:MAG TPA: DUF3991 and TOPRIM domain-containing protein [Acetobacteraceae bacterium]|nr:DUF3991 and TOPRIM domain-containing protein [Acetobacteraceae bacterium]HUN52138.1 DUF3991 and TOPRIM domain-containing protein [Candidatus Sulfotelmatobacter sp.]
MQAEDAELDAFRKGVHCAALLEAWPQPWRLDHRESTRNALKYRRGTGEILIVNHEGRGWWDPQGAAKGDVFDLVQYLDPNLNFGQVRRELRRVVGAVPAFPEISFGAGETGPGMPVPLRWGRRRRLHHGSPVWNYLTATRHLPGDVLDAAAEADVLREGPYGSAWFAHRGDGGAVTHVEIRGRVFKGSLRGGTKTLFRLPGAASPCRRLAIAEAPIDALSLAAIENIRADTLYSATGGGMGPATLRLIEHLLRRLAPLPGACVAGASDANPAGERYAARHAELAAAAGVPFERLRPPIGTDWNDVLQIGGEVGK